jgi:ferritin-like metal-binding protein YciE
MATETTLRKLFIDELRDAYHAEKQLVKALPKMAKAAMSPDLRTALESHLGETETHVDRIEQAFGLLDEPVKAKACAGMQGIIEEGSDVIKEEEKGPALDAAIIAGGQRAEHYEMAAYGTLIAWANTLGFDDVAELLSETLDEEKAADEKLTKLAEGGINAAANADNGEDEGDEAPASSNRKSALAAAGNRAAMRASAKPGRR